MSSALNDARRVDPAGGAPEDDQEPPVIPFVAIANGERCWLCNGHREMLDETRAPVPCPCCNGTGRVGVGR